MTRLRSFPLGPVGALAVSLALLASPATAQTAPVCSTVTSQPAVRLPQAAATLAKTGKLTIVALGSSSTAGVGASSTAKTYPARLQQELAARFPGATITVVNRGGNGEDAPENLRRMDADVGALQPDVVLWQVGTNALLRQFGVSGSDVPMRNGIEKIRSYGAEVVLIDPQYAPWVIVDPDAKPMVQLIDTVGREQNVPVFHRFAMMQLWHDRDKISFPQMSFIDGLHGNDFAYDCLARSLGYSLAAGLKAPAGQPAIASSGAPPAR